MRVAFTFSVLLGVTVALVVALAAPLAALAMRDPRVTSVLRALSLQFALGGGAVVAGGLLRRRLDFRRQFFIESGSYLLGYGGVAVGLALLGFGVWSLVWGGLVQTLVSSVAQVAVVRHAARPLLARSELAELLHFGVGSAVSGTVNYIALNSDNFVVGRWLGAASLGLYSRAYTLMNLPFTYASAVMSSVLFPAFAQVQGEPPRVRRAYLLLTQLTAMVAASAMATMAVVAPHFVRALYGSRWSGAVLPLQILCVAGYFRALYHLGGVVAQSVGRVYGELRNQTIYAGLVIAGALIGSRFDLPGVAVGVSGAILFMFLATAQLALSATGTPWRGYLRVQVGALVTAGVTCSVALAVRLVLESRQATSAAITLAVLAAAAVPWSIGMLQMLGEPDFAPLRQRLPPWCESRMNAIARLAYRSAYLMARAWWFIRRPHTFGSVVAVWCDGRLLLVRTQLSAPVQPARRFPETSRDRTRRSRARGLGGAPPRAPAGRLDAPVARLDDLRASPRHHDDLGNRPRRAAIDSCRWPRGRLGRMVDAGRGAGARALSPGSRVPGQPLSPQLGRRGRSERRSPTCPTGCWSNRQGVVRTRGMTASFAATLSVGFV